MFRSVVGINKNFWYNCSVFCAEKVCRIKNDLYLCTALKRKVLLKKKFWRGGRVVDCGGLENRCAARHPGFESLSLR